MLSYRAKNGVVCEQGQRWKLPWTLQNLPRQTNIASLLWQNLKNLLYKKFSCCHGQKITSLAMAKTCVVAVGKKYLHLPWQNMYSCRAKLRFLVAILQKLCNKEELYLLPWQKKRTCCRGIKEHLRYAKSWNRHDIHTYRNCHDIQINQQNMAYKLLLPWKYRAHWKGLSCP